MASWSPVGMDMKEEAARSVLGKRAGKQGSEDCWAGLGNALREGYNQSLRERRAGGGRAAKRSQQRRGACWDEGPTQGLGHANCVLAFALSCDSRVHQEAQGSPLFGMSSQHGIV
jgi:hypothetical protein